MHDRSNLYSMLFFWCKQKQLASLWSNRTLCTTLAPQDSIVGLKLWNLVGLHVAGTPGKALLLSLLPLRLQGQRCMSGLAVRILEVVAYGGFLWTKIDEMIFYRFT